MYFWVVLASLMGIVMMGNLREKTKDADYFIVPIYESLGQNMLVQHTSVVSSMQQKIDKEGYTWAGDGNPKNMIASDSSGNMQDTSPGAAYYLPYGFKYQSGMTTLYFCVNKANQKQYIACQNTNAVMYVITYGAVPIKYAGASAMSIPKAISAGTRNSRFVGLTAQAEAPLASGSGQPLGAGYYILSAGYSLAASTYIPDAFICSWNKRDPRNFMIALTLIKGLDKGENMASAGAPCFWPAT